MLQIKVWLADYQVYQAVLVRLSNHYMTTALQQTSLDLSIKIICRYIFKPLYPNDKKITYSSYSSLPKLILKAMKYLANILGLCNF